jgi:hypothetical protein
MDWSISKVTWWQDQCYVSQPRPGFTFVSGHNCKVLSALILEGTPFKVSLIIHYRCSISVIDTHHRLYVDPKLTVQIRRYPGKYLRTRSLR